MHHSEVASICLLDLKAGDVMQYDCDLPGDAPTRGHRVVCEVVEEKNILRVWRHFVDNILLEILQAWTICDALTGVLLFFGKRDLP